MLNQSIRFRKWWNCKIGNAENVLGILFEFVICDIRIKKRCFNGGQSLSVSSLSLSSFSFSLFVCFSVFLWFFCLWDCFSAIWSTAKATLLRYGYATVSSTCIVLLNHTSHTVRWGRGNGKFVDHRPERAPPWSRNINFCRNLQPNSLDDNPIKHQKKIIIPF